MQKRGVWTLVNFLRGEVPPSWPETGRTAGTPLQLSSCAAVGREEQSWGEGRTPAAEAVEPRTFSGKSQAPARTVKWAAPAGGGPPGPTCHRWAKGFRSFSLSRCSKSLAGFAGFHMSL